MLPGGEGGRRICSTGGLTQRALLLEGFATTGDSANPWRLARVCPHVLLERLLSRELHVADGTYFGFDYQPLHVSGAQGHEPSSDSRLTCCVCLHMPF